MKHLKIFLLTLLCGLFSTTALADETTFDFSEIDGLVAGETAILANTL